MGRNGIPGGPAHFGGRIGAPVPFGGPTGLFRAGPIGMAPGYGALVVDDAVSCFMKGVTSLH